MKKMERLLLYIVVVSLTLIQGCACISEDSNLRSTQHVTKMLMDREAQKTVVKLLGVTYDPKESKLVTEKQIHNWISENRIDVEKFPIKVQQAINDESAVALLVPRFIPVENQKAVMRSSDIGGLFMALFLEDIGGWWIAGGWDGCDVRCERCTGCVGPNNFCVCSYICCTKCDREECWPCVPCANN